MAPPRIASSPRVTLGVDKDFYGIIATTPWVPAADVSQLRFTRQVNGMSNGVDTRLAYQTAIATRSQPDSWSDVADSTVDPTSEEWETQSATPTLTGKMWVRGGLRAIGDATNPDELSAQLHMQTNGNAKVIASRVIIPGSNYLNQYNTAILARVPCQGITGWMLAVDYANEAQDFSFTPVHALLTGDPEAGPSSWTTGSTKSWTTEKRDFYNTGEISVTDTNTSAWLVCGMRFDVNDPVAAKLRVVVAAIY